MHPLTEKTSWDFFHVRGDFFILTKEGGKKKGILKKKEVISISI
jgi:hypothetical protein